ncbi:hypothetical protein [Sinorhizobium fredii]|uniref:hypothetical protein n=1 Tax=Rhizobium fredii TaxID=380 RepID=UPI0005956DD5|nr:hypothetical protein [Sinorhizobium fredii]WOS62052.1 hypothetical protein SFGR64A_14005 [Sinorhizobium fredii GR64]
MSNNHFLSSDNKKQFSALTIEYKVLGTIPIDELFHAIKADIESLKDIHKVEFVTGAKLKLPVTDNYGQPIPVRRPNGAHMHMMHTYHHRPACKDYEL